MSIKTTYISLIVILTVTFICSTLSLGVGNDILSWFFAGIKSLLILNGFMHFRREPDSSRIYFIVGFLGVLLLLTGILDDVLFR